MINRIVVKAAFVITLSISSAGISGAQSTGLVWQVQKYDVNVTLPSDEKSRTLTGRATLTVKNVSNAAASTFSLRASEFTDLTSVKINDAAIDLPKEPALEKVNAATNLRRWSLRVPSVQPASSLTAVIEYKFTIRENTALSVLSPAGSQFLPLSFWYPTPTTWFYTRGADTAPTRLTVTAPAGQTVVASGVEASGAFDQKLNVQPFFITGSWDVSNQNGVSVYLPKGSGPEAQKRAAELAGLTTDAVTFISGVLGKAPDTPLRIVAGRRGAGFSSGGTIIVDEALFRRSKIDSLTAMNLAEAAARLWLGGSVRVHGEAYGVITEGLVRYLATQFIESRYGKDVADVERLRQRVSYAAVSRRDAPMAIVSPIDDYYYPEVANKGAMMWRILARRIGSNEFYDALRKNMQDGDLTVTEPRQAFAAQKDLVDHFFDKVTDTNLIAGLPVAGSGQYTVALRNSGSVDVTVDVTATTSTGEKLTAPASIRAGEFGEIVFQTTAQIVRAEIDADKLFPQTIYYDDIKPQESTENDPLLAAKKLFDKQDFTGAETVGEKLLRDIPRSDELRLLIARAQLAQNKTADAERHFRAILDEKLPTARSLAWANVGLAEIAAKAGQNDNALKLAEAAIMADADYGASLTARNLRSRLNANLPSDPGVRTFFADFDRSAVANRKAEIDVAMMPGEALRFASGVAGSTEQWQTQVRAVDRLDANTVLVEANLTLKLLNKPVESGLAVYRMVRVGNTWRLAAIDMFEVR